MTRRCAGIRRDGGRCTAIVVGPNDYCYQHDPGRAGERKRAASRAGRARPSREIAELKALKDDVLAGRVDRNDAAVVVQVCRALHDFIELERRVRTTDELERQIAELKERIEGGRRPALERAGAPAQGRGTCPVRFSCAVRRRDHLRDAPHAGR